jgi:hypothetical protein
MKYILFGILEEGEGKNRFLPFLSKIESVISDFYLATNVSFCNEDIYDGGCFIFRYCDYFVIIRYGTLTLKIL